ncbi:hypothetical protein TKK_0000761 [Trichogramma kaykai]
MENIEDYVTAKEEPNDTWSDVGNNYNSDSVDCYKVENFETLPFHELSTNYTRKDKTLPQKFDEPIFVDMEFKHIKILHNPVEK